MKKFIFPFYIACLCFFSMNNLQSQTWDKAFPSQSIQDVLESSDSTLLIFGFNGSSSSYLSRLDTLGDPIWEYQFPFLLSPNLKTMVETNEGDILVGGVANGAPIVFKFSATGTLLWTQSETFDNPIIPGWPDAAVLLEQIQVLETGNIQVFIKTPSGVLFRVFLDSEGNLMEDLGAVEFETFPGVLSIIHEIFTQDGGVCLLGNIVSNTDPEGTYPATKILKYDANGVLEWEHQNDATQFVFNPEYLSRNIIELPQGGYAYAHSTFHYENGDSTRTITLTRLNEAGQLIWEESYNEFDSDDVGMNVRYTANGHFIIAGYEKRDLVIIRTDGTGQMLHKEFHGTIWNDYGRRIKELQNGGFVVAAVYNTDSPITPGTTHLLRTNYWGALDRSFITGNVTIDIDEDCIADSDTMGLHNWIVVAEGVEEDYYDLTSANGDYLIKTDTGEYNVSVISPNDYWEFCESNVSVSLPSYGDTSYVDFQAKAVTNCPAMFVDIATPILRRCFEATYSVFYCNQGTIAAEDSYVEVTLDQHFTVIDSSIPVASQDGTTYTFDLGTVDVQECDFFEIDILVDCEIDGLELGQIHCAEAHIFPDTLCSPLDSLWDGSDIIVDAFCQGDSILFYIRNVGEGNMETPQEYIIIEDHIIFMQEPYQLPSGQEIEISVPTDGIAYRLETSQNPGHPIGNKPSVNVVGCNVEEIPNFLLGFWNSYPDDDAIPFLSIDCQQNVGSFDPNDKRAFPRGHGNENFIEANTEIEYIIRFQNTGTDTAFTVVIEDILSEYLDITTIQPGASSHSYIFDIEDGRNMKFTFNNILLPDSIVNEAKSHGFVKFKVQQIPDNPIGTIIENKAAIFFDYNSPIITNTVFHEIGEDFIEVNIVSTNDDLPHEEKRVLVHPNPFSDVTIFIVKGVENSLLEFTLFDIQGRELSRESHHQNNFKFLRKGLAEGLYFYRIEAEGRLLDAGKIVIK